MITTTNNVKKFFENETGKIIIYGAGKNGHWVGYYMNKCNIPFECYIDKNAVSCTVGGGIILLK